MPNSVPKRRMMPVVKPATNSGIFSNGGRGQKMDPVKVPKEVAAARKPKRTIKPITS